MKAIPKNKVFVRWAFETRKEALFCKRVLTGKMTEREEDEWDDQTVACNFGTMTREEHGNEDNEHDEQAEGFDEHDPGARVTIEEAEGLFVVTYTADGDPARVTVEEAEKFDKVKPGTYGPWYSPTGFPGARGVDPVTCKRVKNLRWDSDEAFDFGDTVEWAAPAKA